MKFRNVSFWILAVLITLAAAYYQRTTGPSYPYRGEASIGGNSYKYELLRSRQQEDAPVKLAVLDATISGMLVFKRFHSGGEWTEIPMLRQGEVLSANLPVQPPAGKLEYYVRLTRDNKVITLPPDRDLVIRFTGDVPLFILVPHIFLMFLSMLLSTRTGLEALTASTQLRKYAFWSLGVLFVGGMIFGPLVQKFAFGSYWTGIPFGIDLTDNKTLIALVGWIVAVGAILLKRHARTWTIIAAVLLLLAFSIPHSMMGSELNYQTGKVGSSQIAK